MCTFSPCKESTLPAEACDGRRRSDAHMNPPPLSIHPGLVFRRQPRAVSQTLLVRRPFSHIHPLLRALCDARVRTL